MITNQQELAERLIKSIDLLEGLESEAKINKNRPLQLEARHFIMKVIEMTSLLNSLNLKHNDLIVFNIFLKLIEERVHFYKKYIMKTV